MAEKEPPSLPSELEPGTLYVICSTHGVQLPKTVAVWPTEMKDFIVATQGERVLIDDKFITGECPKCHNTCTVQKA